MLIASNLGGASWATGDTPAVIQRQYWGFTPAQFAVAMLPRNLIVLLVLTLFACFVAWLSDKCRKTDWSDTLKRLKARDDIRRQSRYQMANSKDAWIGTLALSAFIFLQFVFPKLSLATGSLVFVALVLLTPSDKRTKAFFALGLDATLVITSLFIVAGAVEQTPFVADLAEWLGQHRIPGLIEIAAYVLTIAISADGAAATLAPLVHSFSGGTMISAWQLASGICSGSSSLLTSASAGPVLNSISKQANCELTYRKYAGFGLAFSFVMLVIYLAINFIVR
jgi:Na+/H+ antiporter NhaD/arsenite permease-like protein